MASPFLETVQLSTNFLLNGANDPIIGANVSPDGFSAYPGLLGKILPMTHASAARYADPAISSLFGGEYQYVRATSALARGQLVAWDTFANNGLRDYEVTSTIGAALDGFIAGVALNTVTSGNYCWIQVSGLVNVQFRAAVTNAALGALVIQLTATNTVDAPADATAVINAGANGLRSFFGIAYQLPVNNTITQVMMKSTYKNF